MHLLSVVGDTKSLRFGNNCLTIEGTIYNRPSLACGNASTSTTFVTPSGNPPKSSVTDSVGRRNASSLPTPGNTKRSGPSCPTVTGCGHTFNTSYPFFNTTKNRILRLDSLPF